MSERKICVRGAVICLLLSLLVWVGLYAGGLRTRALVLGFVLGLCVMVASIVLLGRTWRAGPEKGPVAFLYGARVVLIFGSVIAALFLPFVDALGVIVPQLFPGPVLAVLLAMDDTHGS